MFQEWWRGSLSLSGATDDDDECYKANSQSEEDARGQQEAEEWRTQRDQRWGRGACLPPRC